jgi:hypothetical protein
MQLGGEGGYLLTDMFLALLDPDPLVIGMDPDPDPALDPDPSIIKQI